ncbi:hypothetical protein METBIDRAFT_9564 [Metschnikowia bicuspidata var. bicuspidata NRRL YB-4993]|uniref:RRM domain-containing protein n=1 Tax=Metschnikowia bicuspidata var. bicuspidata NRRL YB-4993 TaxID=869754 RepID=A0A1A0HGI9_9ASCO|nr:hypothetical protein METBIDRAFT_9564 [Metschnikowia bicuspidata var. bicuspidata NRRL YB-4993]OBA23284.1 hypothetical protein METBIDRAFT_9564 [Metschnikowia bicuspidata var. bicuspidata NRRL YB-4993]
MSAVTVSHVSTAVELYKLQEFFSFCGNVLSINELDTDAEGFKTYQVNFTLQKAVETALLLNDAELEDVSVKVTKSTLPTYEEAAESGAEVSDNKIQSEKDEAIITGDDSYDDISQEEKPKLAILAQLLASGYKVSDDLIDKAIKFDGQQGISTKFKSFLTDLDSKYLHTQDPESVAAKNLNKAQSLLSSLTNTVQKSSYLQKLQHYFDKASSSPYGAKVHDFYKQVSQEVADVHREATRLLEIKRANASSSAGEQPEST